MVTTNDIFATGTGLREAVQGIQSTFRIDVGNLPGKQLEVSIKGMNISIFHTFSIPQIGITMYSTITRESFCMTTRGIPSAA